MQFGLGFWLPTLEGTPGVLASGLCQPVTLALLLQFQRHPTRTHFLHVPRNPKLWQPRNTNQMSGLTFKSPRFCEHLKVYQFCYHRRPQEFHDIIVLQNSYKWCLIFKINLEKGQHVFRRHIYILLLNGSWKKFCFVCSIFGEVGYLRWKYSGISHLICGRIFGGLGSQLLAFSRSSLCVCRANTHLVSQSTPCKHL